MNRYLRFARCCGWAERHPARPSGRQHGDAERWQPSLQRNFTFDDDALMPVAGRLNPILIVPVIVREQADDPEAARRRAAKAAASGSFDKSHRLSDTISVCIHSAALLYLGWPMRNTRLIAAGPT